jgi:hypothetical protein
VTVVVSDTRTDYRVPRPGVWGTRGLRQACCYGIGIDIEIYTRVILRYYWVVFVNVTLVAAVKWMMIDVD